ncbi:hypothetical protein R3I93_016704 [Phoxinus phoxinus]|uniref:Uncharacterized protein n=1 Tax=Phoxinus phoxinus TaxID=58324 RepID=A0AAN9H1A3_9TELE
MWACLLALPSGRVTLSCCRRDFSNGSTAGQLSEAPDPICDTHWSADGIMVVDEAGETDPTRVLHVDPHTLVLRSTHTDVIFRMDCVKEALMLHCNDRCASPAELQHSNNSVNRSSSDGLFILLSIIFIIFINTV